MPSRRTICIHILVILLIALALRLLYFFSALSYLGMEKLWTYNPDSGVYLDIAKGIISDDYPASRFLLAVGPGYGLIIAGLQGLFGPDKMPIFLFNIALGILAPALIYWLALRLTRSPAAALVAGIISAASPTSLSMSCNALSDQSFFTFHLAAMACFVQGFSSGRLRWFLTAGVLGGLAAYIRGIGQFWPYLFVAISLITPLSGVSAGRRRSVLGAGCAAIIMLGMIHAWSLRNYSSDDIYTFGTNGVDAASAYLSAAAIAEHTPGMTIADVRARWVQEDQKIFGGRSATSRELYERSKARFFETTRSHPLWMLETYLKTIRENMRAGNYHLLNQVPQLNLWWQKFNRVYESWFYLVYIAAALAGIVLLFATRNHFAAILLSVTYLYFSLITGFSFWQGSRLHYPAEMAWSILTAVVIVTVFQGLRILFMRQRLIKTSPEVEATE